MLHAPTAEKNKKEVHHSGWGTHSNEQGNDIFAVTKFGQCSLSSMNKMPSISTPPSQRQTHWTALQQTYGNQAILRTIVRSPTITSSQVGALQRKCDCCNLANSSRTCAECQKKGETSLLEGHQTKLTGSQPGDEYEQEADHIADQVMRMPEPIIQRQIVAPEEDEEEEEGTIQAKPTIRSNADQSRVVPVPSIVHEVLRSPGKPLDKGLRAFMEPRFGRNLSQVQVHTDAKAAESAQAINALAYTFGKNVVFGAGQYVPGNSQGKKLLAHELAHVVQQETTNEETAKTRLTIAKANNAGLQLTPRRSHRLTHDEVLRLQSIDQRIARLETRIAANRRQLDAMEAVEMRYRLMMEQQRRENWPGQRTRGSRNPSLEELSNLYLRPLRIRTTPTEIIFQTRFQLTSLGSPSPGATASFAERQVRALAVSYRAEIQRRWSLRLQQGYYTGRRFRLEMPAIEVIDSPERRNSDAWLIQLEFNRRGNAITDMGQGVIHMPTNFIDQPVVVAHEVAHLFGFFDEYGTQIQFFGDINTPLGQQVLTAANRDGEIGVRRIMEEIEASDPEQARRLFRESFQLEGRARGHDILGVVGEDRRLNEEQRRRQLNPRLYQEDIYTLLERHSVLELERQRAVATARGSETRPVQTIRRAIQLDGIEIDYLRRLRHAIREGQPQPPLPAELEQESLIRPRQDFEREMIRSAEDI